MLTYWVMEIFLREASDPHAWTYLQAMNLAGVYMTEEEVVNLLAEVDESGDGTIDFNEFRNTLLML